MSGVWLLYAVVGAGALVMSVLNVAWLIRKCPHLPIPLFLLLAVGVVIATIPTWWLWAIIRAVALVRRRTSVGVQ